jgi:hypothetical protein
VSGAEECRISFVTNTNPGRLQGEATMSCCARMLALTVQNVVPAFTGLARASSWRVHLHPMCVQRLEDRRIAEAKQVEARDACGGLRLERDP